jgi:hypothetical protein
VADKCRYVTDQPSLPSLRSNDSLRKQKLETEDELDEDDALVDEVTDDAAALRTMGYMTSNLVFNLSKPAEVCCLASPN